MFYLFHNIWDNPSHLTNIFQRGSNHQPDTILCMIIHGHNDFGFRFLPLMDPLMTVRHNFLDVEVAVSIQVADFSG